MTDSDQWIFIQEGCQYIGPDQNPARGPVTYCRATVLAGKSYCAEHHALCYAKPKRKKRTGTANLPAPKINF